MNLQTLLLTIISICLVLLVVMLIIFMIVQKKLAGSQYQEQRRLKALLVTRPKEQKWDFIALRLYPKLEDVPIVRTLQKRMRSRLVLIHAGNEIVVRSRSATLTIMVLVCVVTLSILSFFWTSSWFSRLTIIIVSFYLSGILSDIFIGRLKKQMLYDQSHMILDIRHEYHQTHMVTVSLENAAERSKPLVAAHARQIAGIFNAIDPQEELLKYYEVAPNRYMKQLAGVCYKIGEYGDTDIHKGERSIFLSMLGNIREEIHLEISKREKLDRLLSGIIFVAVAPIFMLDPIRFWAESQFPMVSEFYNSFWGICTLISLYAIFLVCFFALRLIKGDETDTHEAKDEGRWTKRLLKYKWVYVLTDRIVPPEHDPRYFKVMQKLKNANSGLSLHHLYLQKILMALAVCITVVILQLFIHHTIKQNILYPNISISTGGNQSISQKELSEERYHFENALVETMIKKKLESDQTALYIENQLEGKTFLPVNMDKAQYISQLQQRTEAYKEEYYKWYEFIIAIVIGVVSFQLPLLYLTLRSQVKRWEMQSEVDGFNTLAMMLSNFPSISVYEIIEWLHRYSSLFERQLLRCMLDYEVGAWEALENLKEDARFVPLERLADRLQVAADLIPIKNAFDDMEAERAFAMDQRKEHYEQTVSKKSTLGKMFGFLPIQATFMLYLLLPFCYMAFQQLNELTIVTSTM